MRSYIVHYSNKYPGGRVHASETSIDVYCKGGKWRVAMRKNGAGQWVCQSEELGCEDRHDLAPIPRNSRFLKLQKDGKIGKDEEHDSRRKIAEKLAEHPCGGEGKVPSLEELKQAKQKLSPEAEDSDRAHRASWIEV